MLSITAEEFQRVVLRLGNQAFVRYWLHWNYPCEKPWLMAIEVRNWDHSPDDIATIALVPQQANGMTEKGFEWDADDGRYYVERADRPDTVRDNEARPSQKPPYTMRPIPH